MYVRANGHRNGTTPRIGVYVCHCGLNIAATVDVVKVAEYASTLPFVVVARDYGFMCSDPGQNMIKADIAEHELNGVVVASCSPRMHEPTFRRTCEEAGLNQYLFEMANIREQCSWVHEDMEKATEKAKSLVAAAVARVVIQEPLDIRHAQMNPSVLVVGGGVAGIYAALDVANSGHKVYLVEREPTIGGRMAQLDKTFPTLDCSACILTPKLVEVARHPNIKVLTYTEVEHVDGYVGNFTVRVRKKPRYVDASKCTGCGVCQEKCPWQTESEFDAGLGQRKAIFTPFPQAVPNVPVIDTDLCMYFRRGTCRACERFCAAGAIDFDQQEKRVELDVGAIIIATGFDPFDPTPIRQYGFGKYENVYTALQVERLCNAAGPTLGKVVLKNGEPPESVAIIHCVGSRNKNYHEYCSTICCMYSLKLAHLVHERTHAKVYELYMDLRCTGKGYEEFLNRVQEEGVVLVRSRPPEVTQEGDQLVVVYEDTLADEIRRLKVDMVVLSTAIQPRADADEVARLFNIGRTADGFFLERHPKLAPMATATDGVFIAGCAHLAQ